LRDDWHVLALDLRGHGDSEWTNDGNYMIADMVYDVAQLIHQLDVAPVTIIAHSMGGQVCTRFAGTFPEMVRKLVAIEGLGIVTPATAARDASYSQRPRQWVEDKRKAAGRQPRRYPTIEQALTRMKQENGYLSEEQARHLTLHGVNRNEDGSFTWKFDPHVAVWSPAETSGPEIDQMWQAITAPTLMLYGSDSFAVSPMKDGRIAHFPTAQLIEFENAGHWLHHDQFDRFIATVREFL
ncbi:MAG: alpha/beta hydrolase, partial [Novosphingobium sp.]